MNREDELQGIIDFQAVEIRELKAKNAELKEWRRRYDAGKAERDWKAQGGSW